MKQTHVNRLPWRTAWVTGAGRGIGAEVARLLCRGGVTVYGSARGEKALNQLAEELAGEPGRFIPAPLDITDRAQIGALHRRWLLQGDYPDLVVLNAGTHDPFPANAFRAGRFARLLETNLFGTANCLEPVLYQFQRRNQGHIAVVASVAGYRGLPTAAAYGASKAGLINMCEALQPDLANTDVKLQLINPGFVRTPLTDKNEFEMPALLEPDDAARRILAGLQKDQFEITFPWRFVFWLKLLRILPYKLYLPLVRKMTGAGQ